MNITTEIKVDVSAWNRMLKSRFSERDVTLTGLKDFANMVMRKSCGENCVRLNKCTAWVYSAPQMYDYYNGGILLSAYVLRSYATAYAVMVCDSDSGVCEIYNFGDNSGYVGSVTSKSHVNKLSNDMSRDGYDVHVYDLYPSSCYRKRVYNQISTDDFQTFLCGSLIYDYLNMWGAHNA